MKAPILKQAYNLDRKGLIKGRYFDCWAIHTCSNYHKLDINKHQRHPDAFLDFKEMKARLKTGVKFRLRI